MEELKSTNISYDVDKIMKQLSTKINKNLDDKDKNKLINIESDNTTVDNLITELDKKQALMASYTISNITFSNNPSLQLKETIKDPEFIINLISNNATKQNFETFYKEKNILGDGNLQNEIVNWLTPDNKFKKLLALIILHIRLHDDDPKATIDENIKTDITTIITKINNSNNNDNIDTININKLFTKTQSNNGSNPNLNVKLLGNPSSGTSSSGTSSSGTPSSGAPSSSAVKLAQPITKGFINIDLSKLKTIPNSSTIIETIENNTSEIVNNMEKITPDSDSTQIPEVFNTIITKLTIINECITNLKLIEPTFDIENVKYKKLILEYNWLKKSFTKEGTFGATNNIVKMETEFKDRKQIVSSSNINTKSKYNSADYYKIIAIRGSLSEEQRKSVDKLKSESNIKQFIDDLNSNIKEQNDRCSAVEILLRNASTINIPGLLQALTNYKSTNCQNKGQGQGQGQRQGQGQGQWQRPGYGPG